MDTKNEAHELPKRLQKFGSIEHKEAGNNAFKAIIENPENKDVISQLEDQSLLESTFCTLTLHSESDTEGLDPLRLTAGDWIALGGDFYGIPDRPISVSIEQQEDGKYKLIDLTSDSESCKARFLAAYNSLAGIADLPSEQRHGPETELKSILLGITKLEGDIIKQAKEKGLSVKKEYTANSTRLDKYYAKATTKGINHYLPGGFLKSKYIRLAQYNFDHFGDQADTAYAAGHAAAKETALAAYTAKNQRKEEEGCKLLVRALTQELFACHFLTDLFASGHMRTPRVELVQHIHDSNELYQYFDNHIKRGALAGLLAQVMHDEDNELGLQVTSQKHPEPWIAFGDHCYYEPESKQNNTYMQEAIIAALQSIIDIYQFGQEKNFYNYSDYRPKPISVNHDPLFCAQTENGPDNRSAVTLVFRRSNIDLVTNNNGEFDREWSPCSLFARAKVKDATTKVKEDIQDKVELLQQNTQHIVEQVSNVINEVVAESVCRLL